MGEDDQRNIVQACGKIYEDTKDFYSQIASDCGNLGFKILYGPPLHRPPILFIGYQPGGNETDYQKALEAGAHDGWPPISEYATADWKLAKKLRAMFGHELIKQSVGMNAIFIRAPNVKRYKEISPGVREKVSNFCLLHVNEMINLLEPQRIILIGFETLDLFGESEPHLKNADGRTLLKIGKIADRKVLATLHLTGAHIATADLNLMRDHILNLSAIPS